MAIPVKRHQEPLLNSDKIIVADLEKHYEPDTNHYEDTSVSDPLVGYYAYRLQEMAAKAGLPIGALKDEKEVSCGKLHLLELPIESSEDEQAEVSYICQEFEDLELPPIHQFCLNFWVRIDDFLYAIILKNSFLLKYMKEADIEFFEELDNYNAVVIFNEDGPDVCSFVKFKPKNTTHG